ncbi:Ribonuclease T [secondary endosymbiont of Trabutina mannipara]|uniref:Ribonuclease T n=1 Tax=secondary endosymbiont of Trabutina mannipara TaxID=1835721 RepID=A0A1C3L438_9ENTR|nr:ribonuclease T [secondary endosymbiont of Trabutina mannipara]SBT82053.1 Ribonuclease T [secondary endosymbiont of Trabutina mannipara]
MDKLVNLENINTLSIRFRGFYPVVIDVETAGFNAGTDALLEIAAVTLKMDKKGWLHADNTLHFHITPFHGAQLQPEALAFNGIDPLNPLRGAVTEHEALHKIFKMVRKGIKEHDCNRAIIVAHNAAFDHDFLMVAASRADLKNNPFHPFVTFDTAALSGLVLGQTVLAKACNAAGIEFDNNEAHSALYDTERTAALFCELVNRWKRLGGWPVVDLP